jgi:hypothetical protein
VDRDRFDQIAVAVADGQTPRTARRRLFGGSLAALLAAVGLASGDDEAAAKSCAKKCKKKNSNKARKKCRKKCKRQQDDTFSQTGSATLTLQSEPTCEAEGSCIDDVTGEVTGTPIAEGTFEGELTGTNFRDGTEPDTTDIDYAGTITATETSTGDTLDVTLDVTLTRNDLNGDFTYEGTFEISGGTGRFAGATGSGTTIGSGNRPGENGTVEEFTMIGTIDLA